MTIYILLRHIRSPSTNAIIDVLYQTFQNKEAALEYIKFLTDNSTVVGEFELKEFVSVEKDEITIRSEGGERRLDPNL